VPYSKRTSDSWAMLSQYGIEPQPEKIQAIKEWPRPQCIRDVRAFYGLAS